MSKLSAEELANAEAWLRTRSVAINDELVGKLFAHIAALEREMGKVAMRAEFAEAGIPGLIFSKRKALVEHCAQIVESYARKAGEDRAYMLKGPAFWLRDIANAVRANALSTSPSELAGDVVSQPPGIDPTRPGAIGAAEVFPDDAGDGEEC